MLKNGTYHGAIFDFDGTLVNTLEDLANAVNHTLEHFGLPMHPVESYQKMVGNGVFNLLLRATGLSEEDTRLEDVLVYYKAYYAIHGTDLSKPYAGIQQLLTVLRERRIPIAIFSNKPQDATSALAKLFFPSISFSAVLGARPSVPIKPDSTGVFQILDVLGMEAQRCLFVGDSNVDMITAKNAGCGACGVLWGFRDGQELLEAGADYLVSQPSDILSLFEI